MSGLLEDCRRLFATDCLYTLFDCERSCSHTELKRAFYKKSLKYHPDRHDHQEKSEATERFQVLSAAFRILSDKETRSVYDKTGIVGESFSEKSFKDWVDYWTLIFPKVTAEAIIDFADKYHGSKEERNDLIELYKKHKGDMDAIMDSMILAEATDEDRIRKLIEELIAENVLEPLDAFVNEPPKKRANRLKRALKEANDCAKEKKKKSKKDASTDSLLLALQANQQRRLAQSENVLDQLTEKYCKPQNKRKTSKK
uniref:DnaJ homolog subfamily C member 9 n=1 Tax=Schistocephalus solidus TaxID=70667 RepID=A0A0X3PC31_SCHSO